MAAATTSPAPNGADEPRPLCAYSPRWLSGPTPAYEGLVATWRRPFERPGDDG